MTISIILLQSQCLEDAFLCQQKTFVDQCFKSGYSNDDRPCNTFANKVSKMYIYFYLFFNFERSSFTTLVDLTVFYQGTRICFESHL